MARRAKRSYGVKPRRPEPVRPASGHTFLIVVEGEATEVCYLEEVRSRLKRRPAAVLVAHGKHTDPVGMVREAIKWREEQRAKPNSAAYDEVWVVFDRERQNHPRREQVPAALELARASDIKVALTIPSIEFWFYLHFDFTTAAFDGCAAVRKALKKFLKNYKKSALPLDDLLARTKTAMKHAARCRKHWRKAGGDRNPSTEVDELIRALNDSARASERLF